MKVAISCNSTGKKLQPANKKPLHRIKFRYFRTALLLTIPASLCFATRSRSPLLSLVHRLKSLKTNLIKFHTLKNTFHFLISISIISSYFLRNTLSSSIHPHTELSKVQYGNFGLFVKKAIKYDFVSLIKTESVN